MDTFRKYTEEFREFLFEQYMNDYSSTYRSLSQKYNVPLDTVKMILSRKSTCGLGPNKTAGQIARAKRNKAIAAEYGKVQKLLADAKRLRSSLGPKYGLNTNTAVKIARQKLTKS